jgi:3-methyladenine DNA glycosylase/8-oxoguanine DNA glycosylase
VSGGGVVVERDVRPCGQYRMPYAGRDGVMRRQGPALVRLMHVGEEPVTTRAWAGGTVVRMRAEAGTREGAEAAIERMRFALGTDHELSEFHRAYCRDPLIGPVIRRKPWLRPRRRPEPFEALVWAICEQLIESGRAAGIERRLVYRWGRRSACGTLAAPPSAAQLAGRAPAELEACGLAGKRAIAMVRAAREVAAGRVDLATHEPAWRRLLTISNIGAWTVEKLAFEGQGRDDQLPAGDLAYVKLVGRLARLGRRATVEEVREFFAPYGEYAGLAGTYALHAPALSSTG